MIKIFKSKFDFLQAVNHASFGMVTLGISALGIKYFNMVLEDPGALVS